eukprot:TRINITY_DN1803_c0_g1_i3.p1 TRINITY_DN1803_c0_g1~~TRINITY_DN1803_c0_g1_i3.p1  ORF type:complete len:851 (+),score=329.23 TRINITY_DN1803_c0_g1_i3:117-2555(+)
MRDLEQKEKGEDEEEEEDDKDMDDLDREMGKLDNDNKDVVDEKLWNSEDEDENQEKEDEKYEDDAPVSGENLEVEMMAKEEEEKANDKQKPKPKPEKDQQKAGDDKEEEEGDKEEEFPEAGEGSEEEGENVNAEQENEENHDMDLELPEELKLDEVDEAEDAEEGEEEKEEEEGEGDGMEEEKEEQVDAEQINEEEKKDDDGIAEVPDPTKQDLEQPKEEQEQGQPESHIAPDELKDKSKQDDIYGVQSNQKGGDTSIQPDQKDQKQQEQLESGEDQKESQSQMSNQSDSGQRTQSQSQPESSANFNQNKPRQREPNPYESLGNALKQWMKRVQILQREQEAAVPDEKKEGEEPIEDGESNEEQGAFEHVHQQEQSNQQALATATQQQMEQMGPMDNKDEEKEKEKESNEKMEDQQTEEKPDQDSEMKSEEPKKSDKLNPRGSTMAPEPLHDDEEDDDKESSDSDEKLAHSFSEIKVEENSLIGSGRNALNSSADKLTGLSAEELQRLRTELDADLQQWSQQAEQQELAFQIWRKLDLLTSDLATQLCEQLRIILEPTLASKLSGDYRTGKRINMKKVIPYVASQFRKDKIWLRRSRPSKRAYQILMAIDDSESMMANGAGRLALEAVSMMCRALTRLDVGQIGLLSFGEQIRLLHPFHLPFTDQSAAYSLSQFHFNQSKTQWPKLLENVVGLLEQAKLENPSSASQDHLQLVFIISDARVQQERDIVARWSREAADKRQLLVLIVIDTIDSNSSILSLKSVTYPGGKIKVVEYLDNFPFPYYIILRKLEALPEIVADALRQWFELIQSVSS